VRDELADRTIIEHRELVEHHIFQRLDEFCAFLLLLFGRELLHVVECWFLEIEVRKLVLRHRFDARRAASSHFSGLCLVPL